jgi:TldD protein
MNVRFPEGFYCDVRVEDVTETVLQVTLSNWEQIKERAYTAAFIRLFDGKRWYYASTTDIDSLQSEIDSLAAMGAPNSAIAAHSIVRLYETNTGNHQVFTGSYDVRNVPLDDKVSLLESYVLVVDGREYVELWRTNYVDQHVVKTFVSSKGADLSWDYQKVGFRFFFKLAHGEEKFGERYERASNDFADLSGLDFQIEAQYSKAVEFLLSAKSVEGGTYPVILSPEAAGVFAHESFGHKSESDFMIGDEVMKKEWEIGKKIGAPILSIIEDGRKDGVGRIPFDDEGTAARENYLIRDGVLAGRLHSGMTAASDRKSTRLNSSHNSESRMPSSA